MIEPRTLVRWIDSNRMSLSLLNINQVTKLASSTQIALLSRIGLFGLSYFRFFFFNRLLNVNHHSFQLSKCDGINEIVLTYIEELLFTYQLAILYLSS